jgi:hypothetical protein
VTASSPPDGVYGDPVPTITASYIGFVYSQGSSALTTAPSCSTSYTQAAGSVPGTYGTSCSGATSGNYNFSYVDGSFKVGKAPLTVTAEPKTMILNGTVPTLTATYAGFKYGQTLATSGVTGSPILSTSATSTSPIENYAITIALGTLAAGNYSFTLVNGNLSITYAPPGTCNGDAGHTILQPINVDGTSVFKQGSTVPAKFRVCDANGRSIGQAGVVQSFDSTVMNGTPGGVNETIVSTTPDTAFRWDSTSQQWIFNISTKNLSANHTYIYVITLNDGSQITFRFALK